MTHLLEKVEACRKALGHDDATALVRLALREVEDTMRRQARSVEVAKQGAEAGEADKRAANVLAAVVQRAHSALGAVQHELATKGGYVTAATRRAVEAAIADIEATVAKLD